MRSRKSGEFLPALTGVRFIAASMVYFHHWVPLFAHSPSPLRYVFRQGYTGVSVFFVLSGFVIAHRYYEDARMDFPWLARYIRARFARIYPIYFLLTYAVFGAWDIHGFKNWFYNLTLLKGFFHDYAFSGIPQSWSLTVEELFYLTAPFTFWCFRRGRAWAAGLLYLGAGVLLVMQPWHGDGFMDGFPFLFNLTFLGRFFEFFVGIALARWYRGSEGGAVRAGFPLRTWLGAFGFAGCIGALAYQGTQLSEPGLTGTTLFGTAMTNWVMPLWVGLFYMGLLTERSWIRWLLGSGPLVVLGQASYVLYLAQAGAVRDWFVAYVTADPAEVFLYVVLVSVVLYYTVEQPMSRLIRGEWRLPWRASRRPDASASRGRRPKREKAPVRLAH